MGNKVGVHNNCLHQENYLEVIFNQSGKRTTSWAPLTRQYKLLFRDLSRCNDLFIKEL